LCNGEDDNCNGQIDEGIDCACLDGSVRSCGSSVGACVAGEQTCTNGQWNACVGKIDASVEVCNGVDDDCDSLIDEDIADDVTGSSVGVCMSQIRSCIEGSMQLIQESVGSSLEICDGLDNDCNGEIDEALGFFYTGSDEGQCVSEARGCVDGNLTVVREQVSPVPELCDGLDNDCDGVIDEELEDRIDGSEVGECQISISSCIGGQYTFVQDSIGVAAEVCDGLDNDCDGLIDEQIASLFSGTDLGQCQQEIRSCVNGEFSIIQPLVEVSSEICDGLDNDCDGVVDNGIVCACEDGATRSCGNAVGACVAGDQTCLSGQWGDCTGEVLGTSEVCDGIDNDCDGSVDEDLQPTITGVQVGHCQPEIIACVDGSLQVISQQIFSVEEQCNGIDDDCDGLIDEGLTHEENTTTIGTCVAEKWECVEGNMTKTRDSIFPQLEDCDYLDNDCDGQIDEGCPGAYGGPAPIPEVDYPTPEPVVDQPTPEPSLPPTEQTSEPTVSAPPVTSRRRSRTGITPVKPSPFRGPLRRPRPPAISPTITSAASPSPSLLPSIIKKKTSGEKLGIQLIMGPIPASLSPADPIITIPAVVKNVGNRPLSDITAAAFPSQKYWAGSTLPIKTLDPGEEKAVSFTLRPVYCTQELEEGEYHIDLSDVGVQFVARETGVVSDEKFVSLPLRVEPLTLTVAPQDYSVDQTMKVCYFIGNPGISSKEKLEIEFELHDRQDDVIIDYISPVRVGGEEILLKVKDYDLYQIPRQKSYNLRGFLYENGTLFSPDYLVGEDRSEVDLSKLTKQDRFKFMKRIREVFY